MSKKSYYSLVGVDGNAHSIMAYVVSAMRDVRMSNDLVDAYRQSAMSGNYDNLIMVSSIQLDEVNSILDGSYVSTVPSTLIELHNDPKVNEDRFDELFKLHVPPIGPSDTLAGEIIRAVSRIGYRFLNDGDRMNQGYGIETTNMAGHYLMHHADSQISDVVKVMMNNPSEDDYRSLLNVLVERTIESIQDHPEWLTTENPCDMFDYDDPSEYECDKYDDGDEW